MPISKSTIDKQLAELRRLTENRTKGTNRKIKKLYKSLLKDLKAFISDTYIDYADDEGRLDLTTLQAKAYYANFISEIEKRVNDITPETSQEIRSTVEKVYSTCYDGMVKAVENAANDNSISLDLKQSNVKGETLKRAVENPVSGLTLPDILEKNRREVVYDIKTAVNIGLINGLRYETVAKNITSKLDISYNKALNITSTETHRVQESGLLDSSKHISSALEKYGLVEAVTWRTMQDEKVRPQRRAKTRKHGWSTKIVGQANHVKMEGVTIRAGEKFQLEPGVSTESPGNSGVARHDCRCRCYLEYSIMTAEEFEEVTGKKVDIVQPKAEVDGRLEDKFEIWDYDEEQFERYKTVLKELAPKNLEEFKKVKSNAEKWTDLKYKYRTLNRYDIPENITAKKVLELDKAAWYTKQKGFDFSNYSGNDRKYVKKLKGIGNAAVLELDKTTYFSHSRVYLPGTIEYDSYNGNLPLVGISKNRKFSVKYLGDKIDRRYDTEAKLLEFVADNEYNKKEKFEITILSEKHICESCQGVVNQFKKMYPNSIVNIISGKKGYNNSSEGLKTWKHRKKVK